MILCYKNHHGNLKELLFYINVKDAINFVTSQDGFIMLEEPLILDYKSLIPGGQSQPHTKSDYLLH